MKMENRKFFVWLSDTTVAHEEFKKWHVNIRSTKILSQLTLVQAQILQTPVLLGKEITVRGMRDGCSASHGVGW